MTAAEVEKLIKDAPNWNRGTIPHLDHDSAYDFVAYDWPKIRRYIRSQSSHIQSLEAKLKIAREALEVINHDITPWVRSYQFSEWNDVVRSVESVSKQALSQLSL